jgi:streptomycin 6-kinase
VLGDPAFDVANLFYNPLEGELRYDPARAARLASVLAPAVEREPAELLDWAFAFTALSASWHAEDGNMGEAAKSLRVGRAVAAARELVA